MPSLSTASLICLSFMIMCVVDLLVLVLGHRPDSTGTGPLFVPIVTFVHYTPVGTGDPVLYLNEPTPAKVGDSIACDLWVQSQYLPEFDVGSVNVPIR